LIFKVVGIVNIGRGEKRVAPEIIG